MQFNLSSDLQHVSSMVPHHGSPSPSFFKPSATSQSFKQPQGQQTPTREETLISGYSQQYQHILQQSPTSKQSYQESQQGQAQQLIGSSRSSSINNNTQRAYSFQLNQLGVTSTPRSRREKSADRFIPQMKVSSNYFSLLLSEHKLKTKKQGCKQQSGAINDLEELDQQQQVEHLGNQYNERIAEDDGSTNSLKGEDDEDAYSMLLRNNIVKEVNDFNNQPSMNSSCSSNALKMHSRHAVKAPKVLSYTPRMSIAKQQLFLAQSEDIVFTEEPQESRKISSKPYKILDAPGMSGDFYTNILDWTSSNLVVVALNNQIYTWSPIRHDVNNLSGSATSSRLHSPNPNVVSLSCNSDGKLLATADEHGYVKLYDIERSKVVQEFQGHTDRIGAIAWNENLLTTASKDFTIKLRDIRSKTNTSVLNLHKEQVCGIKWSYDGVCLASGGNDNRVCVYNHKMNKLSSVFSSHSGAVKALAWSPHKHNTLVSGGGNKDQTLKFWNTHNNTLIKSIHTGSQVCNMVFSKHQNEILTTHGFQLNQVSLWRADTYQQVATLYGHSERVLYLALSPDHEDIVTGSADETLRFWKVFGKKKKREESANSSSLDPFFSTIR